MHILFIHADALCMFACVSPGVLFEWFEACVSLTALLKRWVRLCRNVIALYQFLVLLCSLRMTGAQTGVPQGLFM